ncbi:MAG TPA: adenylate/guanylate cyclase domain-containing protein, partial [Thermoleophilaceae bacterium]|nr:adenylate/guanylate cyclase domain-containing protein [Thermoleophilaceae bacterium]
MSWQRRGSRLWLMVVAGVLCAALGAVLQERDALDSAEMDTVDLRFQLRGDQAKPKDIVLVAIDGQSLQDLNRLLPFPRRLHARAIDRLRRAGARQIVYDIQFTEETTVADDNALFEAVRRAGTVVLATSEVRRDGGTDVLGGPAGQRAARASVGNAALSKADSDRVIRRYARATDGLESLAVVAARELGAKPARGPFRPDGAWIDYPGPPGTIDTVRFSDLLAGRVPASRLRGKVAVVAVTDPNEKDVYGTPGSGAEVMAGGEIQAHALDTIRRDFPLRPLPGGWAALFAALFGLAMPMAALKVRRWPWLAPVAAVVLAAIAYLAFLAGVIVPVAAPLAALVVGTLATLAVDLATGSRARERMRGAFARFVPAQIVDDVIERTGDDYRLTGDRLEATVLFCDLRGFTTLAESLDAERVIEVLDRYLTEMSDAILDQDGTVVSYMGDGIMAVFGAPIADDDHAAKAVAAAREMIGPRLEAFNAWLAAEGVAPGGVRMGIGL